MTNKRKKLELVQRILKQALEISTNTSIDVFVDYASHVKSISVKVFLKGWCNQNNPDLNESIYIDNDYIEPECIEKLKEIEKYLKNIEKENN